MPTFLAIDVTVGDHVLAIDVTVGDHVLAIDVTVGARCFNY